MREFKYISLFILILLLLAGCSPQQQEIKNEKENIPSEEIYVKYQYSSEMKNDIIEINNTKLEFTYVIPGSLDDVPMVMEQRPYWTDKDLETIEKTLTAKQVGDLIILIKTSGFFKLNRLEGVQDDGQRYYPYFLTVKIGDKLKEVEYRSNPEGPVMPTAFSKIKDHLYSLAGSNQ